jgi:hypothetical protein
MFDHLCSLLRIMVKKEWSKMVSMFKNTQRILIVFNNNNNNNKCYTSLSSSATPTLAAAASTLNMKSLWLLSSQHIIKGRTALTSVVPKNMVELKMAMAMLDASGIQLPHDHKTMSALYMEATFHGITELQQALTDYSFWVHVKSLFGIVRKSSVTTNIINPFNAAATTKAFMLLHASLLALGGVVGTVMVTKASSSHRQMMAI